jgi:hypothetical protein
VGRQVVPYIWFIRSNSIKITGIDGNKVHLTGFYARTQNHPDTDEVYGRIEYSTLLLTWPVAKAEKELKMKREDSNNLILDGHSKTKANVKVQFEKIE